MAVTHRHVTALFSGTATLSTSDPDDVWTMFHSVAFDFSVWELWGPLLHGGRLVVVAQAVARDPDRFARAPVDGAGHGAQPDPVGVLSVDGHDRPSDVSAWTPR